MTPTTVSSAPCASALGKPFGEKAVLYDLALSAD
jgi:hypothetical protein